MPSAKMKPRKNLSVVNVLLALFVLWLGLWGTMAFTVRHAIEAWARSSQEKPLHIEVSTPKLDGFPFEVVWRFASIKGTSENGPAFTATNVRLHAHPWDWSNFRFSADETEAHNIPLPSPRNAFSFKAASSEGHLREDNANSAFELTSLRLLSTEISQNNAELFKADEIEFIETPLLKKAESYKDTGANITLTGRGILLGGTQKNPLGSRIEAANAFVRVMGVPPDFQDRKEVEAWNNASGVFECDSINLIWGPLSAEVKGTLALTPDLQPEGAFTGNVRGLKEAITALQTTGALDKRQATVLKNTMPHFAKPVEDGEKGEVEIPLSVQQGGLFLGPLRLLDLPRINWPPATPPGA